MPYLEFWSDDNIFGLKIPDRRIKQLLRLCGRSSPCETGGILLGRYSNALDYALVTSITNAPADSRSGRTWFVRGVRGLQSKIDNMWRRKEGYYLGEWHFHPFGEPSPSGTDSSQMREIARSPQYRCPEPILLIIGGDPPKDWTARAFIYLSGQKSYIT
jgi:integrative and conjugative element protein (TIGR02256 family)